MFVLRFLLLITLMVQAIFFVPSPVKADATVYNIAYIDHFYPFQQKGVDEQEEGFVIDLLKAIARTENITFHFRPMTLDDAIISLKNNEIDGIAGLKYTSEMDQMFDFSQPFTTVSHTLLVPQGNTSIQSLPDLGGKVVAIERGDVSLEILQNVRKVEVLVVKNQEEAFYLLEKGRADAFLGNTFYINALLKNKGLDKQYRKTEDMLLPSDYAFATREGNQQLIKTINRGLTKIRANQEYQTIYSKWFDWNSELTERMKKWILFLILALSAVLLYVVFAIRWNRKLKQEVYRRTLELEKTNKILERKIEEEKNLRQRLIHKEKMQALGQLVAGIAHELRNPLTSIKAFVELIPEKFESNKFREEVSKYVPSEINRLNKLLTNLLDYAKPGEPKKQNFSVQEWIESVLPFFQIQFNKKNIAFTIHISKHLYAYADYGQMKQVLINILLNAMDAVDKHGKILITSYEEEDLVVIKVTDTGKGISPEKMDLIFEPFYTDKQHGTGLGLSLCQQYMKDNNGQILIESIPGEGTTVILKLPKGGQ